jgi:hypothetical protein
VTTQRRVSAASAAVSLLQSGETFTIMRRADTIYREATTKWNETPEQQGRTHLTDFGVDCQSPDKVSSITSGYYDQA